ncbi:MAG: hydrogenase maturation protease [Firmicutes bacterium]|nr:hydrogenase maturation protease [Bacillota bacterium]
MKKIRIIGCGNLLAHDEGVGVHVVRRLQNEILPENVEIQEMRTPGKQLTELLTGTEKIIIIDACTEQNNTGTVHRHVLKESADEKLQEKLFQTLHAYNLYPFLKPGTKTSSLGLPREIVIICIEIEERHRFCVGLSQKVFAVVDDVVAMIMKELY